MRTPTNEDNHAIQTQRKQGVGEPFFTVITKAEHAAIHEREKMDIERNTQAAGAEMLKTARIAVRRGMRQQQETGLKELNKLLQDIKVTKDHKSVVAQTGIATGYANAMHHFGLISASELKDVIEVIGQAGERATSRIEAENRPFWLRIIRKWVRI